MKICIVSHTFPRFKGDPSAPFMGGLVEGLVEAGHQVTILLPYDLKLDLNQDKSYKIQSFRYAPLANWHRLGYSRTLQGDKKLKLETYLLSPLLIVCGAWALWNLARRERFDVISAHWIVPNGFFAALVSKIVKIPLTITIPGSDIYLGTKNMLFRWMVGFAAAQAQTVISDSQHYLDQLFSLGYHPKQTKVIRYGVNEHKFQPTAKDPELLKKYQLTTKTPVVLAVGRLVAKKGFMFLIEAMTQITKENPEAKLLLVGDGDLRTELERRIRDLGLQQSVILAGTISYDQLAKYYNLADVFVMPSIRDESGNIDASPVAMMEAMCCGTAVVATRFSGSSDLVVDGKTGVLVTEKDSSEIAEAVLKILAQSEKAATKAAVRKIAVNNFSNTTVGQRYTQVFENCILDKRTLE